MANLRTGAGRAAGNFLQLNTTVFVSTDPAGPHLGGGGGALQSTEVHGNGGLDWYFTGLPSSILDRESGEQVN